MRARRTFCGFEIREKRVPKTFQHTHTHTHLCDEGKTSLLCLKWNFLCLSLIHNLKTFINVHLNIFRLIISSFNPLTPSSSVSTHLLLLLLRRNIYKEYVYALFKETYAVICYVLTVSLARI
jgi:hypothetical protein